MPVIGAPRSLSCRRARSRGRPSPRHPRRLSRRVRCRSPRSSARDRPFAQCAPESSPLQRGTRVSHTRLGAFKIKAGGIWNTLLDPYRLKGAHMPQVTHVEWPAGDADRLQSFLEGLFGWEFGSPMEGMDYRMARTSENEGAAVYPAEQRGLLVYYDVDDLDAHVAKVRDSGGEAEDKMPV